jgi:adenylate kinase family enzyme
LSIVGAPVSGKTELSNIISKEMNLKTISINEAIALMKSRHTKIGNEIEN